MAAKLRFIPLFAVLVGMILTSWASPSAAYQRPGTTKRVSVASDGTEGREAPVTAGSCPYCGAAISANARYVVFDSPQDNLVPGDINNTSDVFRHDLVTSQTELVSLGDNGAPAVGACVGASVDPNGDPVKLGVGSTRPSVSRNGRFIVFQSCAVNLVGGDTNGTQDVFVRDMKRGHTTRVSVSSAGSEGEHGVLDGCASGAIVASHSITADGRYVVFSSKFPNLVPDDTNGQLDVFVHDTSTRVTSRVSVATDGTQGDRTSGSCTSGGSRNPAVISTDGKVVAFWSKATNLTAVPPDPAREAVELDSSWDVFTHEIPEGKTERVSVTQDGRQAAPQNPVNQLQYGIGLSINSDGRFVTFASAAPNFVPTDTNRTFDAFVKDRKTGRLERISVSPAGEEGPNGSAYQGVSMDETGRYVAFTTSSQFVPSDEWDDESFDQGCSLNIALSGSCSPLAIYIYDRRTGATELGIVPPSGRLPSTSSRGFFFAPTLSPNGRHLAFVTTSDYLVDRDTNKSADWFVRDRGDLLGIGGLLTSGSLSVRGSKAFRSRGFYSASDATDDVSPAETRLGGNLIDASIAYRPTTNDLFGSLELEDMPAWPLGSSSTGSPLLYGLRFTSNDTRFEVRAASHAEGTFGLFDCSDGTITCTKVENLKGGFGTTGERVVFSLPLEEIGLENGGELSDVEAFTALGSYYAGPLKTVDSVSLN